MTGRAWLTRSTSSSRRRERSAPPLPPATGRRAGGATGLIHPPSTAASTGKVHGSSTPPAHRPEVVPVLTHSAPPRGAGWPATSPGPRRPRRRDKPLRRVIQPPKGHAPRLRGQRIDVHHAGLRLLVAKHRLSFQNDVARDADGSLLIVDTEGPPPRVQDLLPPRRTGKARRWERSTEPRLQRAAARPPPTNRAACGSTGPWTPQPSQKLSTTRPASGSGRHGDGHDGLARPTLAPNGVMPANSERMRLNAVGAATRIEIERARGGPTIARCGDWDDASGRCGQAAEHSVEPLARPERAVPTPATTLGRRVAAHNQRVGADGVGRIGVPRACQPLALCRIRGFE